MQFKSGQIFWGIFFLTLGTLFFLNKYEVFQTDYYFIWDLWPVVFVFIGLMVIVRDTFFRPIIGALFGAYVGLMLFGALNNTFSGNFVDVNVDLDNTKFHQVQKFYEPFDEEIQFADLYLTAGIGICEINRSTRDLIRGIARGTHTDYYFDTEQAENKAKVILDMDKENFVIRGGEIESKLEIQLNEKPVWDLDLEIGAAKANFDLSDYKVRKINLKTGATDIRIKIGNLYDETYIDVEMGAASLEIKIPREFGCKIDGEMALIKKDFDDFIEKNDDTYVTENYNDTNNKIMINVEGAVASLKIIRY